MDTRHQKLRNKALKLLAQREHSETELIAKLTRTAQRAEQRTQPRRRTGNGSATQVPDGESAHLAVPTAQPPSAYGSAKDAVAMQRAAQFVAQQAGNARKSDLVPTAQIRSAYLATDPPCEIDADPPLAPAITDVAKAVVAQLRDAGYQSDARTAHSLVRHWSGRVSRSLLEHKLKTAGIAREESSTALSEEAVATTDFDTALALWNNKFRAPPEDEKTKARQVRFLQSRGFSPSTALRVLKAVGARTDESD